MIKTNQSGFTIVELITGIVLMGLFVATVASLQNNEVKLAQRGRDVSVVNSYAENKIESLRSAGYLAVNNGTSDVTNELPSELKSPRSATLTVSLDPVAMKRVVLSITYNDQGTAKTYSYTTYIGEVGVGQQ
jgi:type II secretory pathway pseudopilin PulG